MPVYLYVNLCDLDDLGTVGGMGSPLLFFIRPDLGDDLQPGAYYRGEVIDDGIVVVKAERERADAIAAALDVLGRRKIGRPVRCEVRRDPPGRGWRYVSAKSGPPPRGRGRSW